MRDYKDIFGDMHARLKKIGADLQELEDQFDIMMEEDPLHTREIDNLNNLIDEKECIILSLKKQLHDLKTV